MLIKKIFYREIVSNAVKILIALIVILPIEELFKLLDRAASGNLPTATIFTAMIYGTIASFPMALIISCFLTVTITINRFCKEQEFVIWLSSGISPFYWFKLTAFFAVPMSIICAICTMYITPWANAKSNEYSDYVIKQQVNMMISPGVFKENPSNNQVFYLEHYSLIDGLAQKIFVQYADPDSSVVYNLTALSGNVYNNDGVVSVVLNHGHRYQLSPSADNRFMELDFDTFKASIKQIYSPNVAATTNNANAMPSALIKQHSGSANAELSWRIANALSMLVMSLIAVPISMQIGRRQSGLIFIIPALIYAAYQNLILSLNSYVGSGVINSVWGIQVVHPIMIGIVILLTYIKTLPKGYLWSRNKK